MTLTSVTIVTPWLGHHELAADYVAAVLPEVGEGDEVIIVANGDAPLLPFKAMLPMRNLGFVGGSNHGLKHADTDAVLFLNNDIALGRKGWLDEIREALEPGVLVGPVRSYAHADVDGTPLPYIDGWCLAGMRDDLLELGGFDEELQEPAYYSDNLLCLEARARGMTLCDLGIGMREWDGLVHKLNVTAGPATAPDVQAASAANRTRYVDRARAVLSSVTT